jgi:hypothetical protein
MSDEAAGDNFPRSVNSISSDQASLSGQWKNHMRKRFLILTPDKRKGFLTPTMEGRPF